MFKKIVKNFGPEWGAAVMGTAAICITMQLSAEVARPFSPLLYVGLGFYLLATIMFTAFLIPWTLRFFMYPEEVKKDLQHSIRGNFFPTMPISFILAGTGTNKLGPMLFNPSFAYHLSIVFFFLGAIGIFTFGYLLIRTQFLSRDIRLEHANFSWFIPPVSHLIIPVLGVCSMDVYWAETSLAPVLFVISMIALGVGFFNFLFVGAAIWHRYTYQGIPEARLASTIMVGIAPTAIIVVFLIKFGEAIEASHGSLFGINFMSVFPLIKIIASVLWGYSLWWLILVVILITHYITTKAHPFVFGWWAYTFPFEAFTVSTGLLAKCIATNFVHGILITLNILAVIIWIIVVFGTIKWLESGALFAPEH
jgi:C4-dicarboxylate transporter/malic acid transport protein